MKKHGVGCWSKLLPEFEGRIGKQLRERWNHELRPDINKQGWTHEEERHLVKAHRDVGNSWAEIAKVQQEGDMSPCTLLYLSVASCVQWRHTVCIFRPGCCSGWLC